MAKGWGNFLSKFGIGVIGFVILLFPLTALAGLNYDANGDGQFDNVDVGWPEYIPIEGWRFAVEGLGNETKFSWSVGPYIQDFESTHIKPVDSFRIDFVKKNAKLDTLIAQGRSNPKAHERDLMDYCRISSDWKEYAPSIEDPSNDKDHPEKDGHGASRVAYQFKGGGAGDNYFRLVGIIDGTPRPLSCTLESFRPPRVTETGEVILTFEANDADTHKPIAANVKILSKELDPKYNEALKNDPTPVTLVVNPNDPRTQVKYTVEISKEGYKTVQKQLFLNVGNHVTANLAANTSKTKSTVTDDPDDAHNNNGIKPPVALAHTPTAQECNQYLGLGYITNVGRFQPLGWLVCQATNLTTFIMDWVSKNVTTFVPL